MGNRVPEQETNYKHGARGHGVRVADRARSVRGSGVRAVKAGAHFVGKAAR